MTTRPTTLLVLGYAPVVKRDVRVTPAAMTVDVGQLSLTSVAVELSAVAVTAPTLIAATIPAAGVASLGWTGEHALGFAETG